MAKSKEPMSAGDILCELRLLRTRLAFGKTFPNGWEHWMPNVQSRIHVLEADLAVLQMLDNDEPVMMFYIGPNGQNGFAPVHVDDVERLENMGWKRCAGETKKGPAV